MTVSICPIAQTVGALDESSCSPFNPTLFLFRLSIASWNRPSPAAVSPDTLYCSHSTGTFRPSKISLTESVISFPIPSPGTSVTVYLPGRQLRSRRAGSTRPPAVEETRRTTVLSRQLSGISDESCAKRRSSSDSPSSRRPAWPWSGRRAPWRIGKRWPW